MRTWLALCLLVLALSAGHVSGDDNEEFRLMQAMHKPRTLKTSKIRKLADLSDRTSFKSNLLNPLLRVRDVGSAGHTQARQHIVNQMSSVGWNIEEDRFDDNTPLGRKTFTNVIATQNVNAPRRLTIACHYDSKYFTQFQFIAMSDSAVPCAMMLDLARTLNESLWKNRDSKGAQISLQFIFFDGEEAFNSWTKTDSIYGSRHLAAKWENEKVPIYREMPPVSQNARMDALILLDLIGYKNPTFKNWFSETSHLFERLKKIELRLVREKSLEFEYESKSSRYFTGSVMAGLGVEDDHIPFLQRGVPIMHLIAYPFPQVWHNEQDNASNYDPVSTDNLLKIMRVFIAEYLHLDP